MSIGCSRLPLSTPRAVFTNTHSSTFGSSIPRNTPKLALHLPKCGKLFAGLVLHVPNPNTVVTSALRAALAVLSAVQCFYANEPLTAAPPATPGWGVGRLTRSLLGSGALIGYRFGPIDPFHSYPHTRLPQKHVERLIHSYVCLWSSRRSKLRLPIQFFTRSLSNTTLLA
jgi:hypothetical protein